MKPIIIILIFTSLVATGAFLASHYTNPGTMVQSVIIDKTDSFLAKPAMNEILLPLHLDEHKWDQVNFRFQTISSHTYNSIATTNLQSRIELVSNPDERDREVTAFRTRIATQIDSINRLANGRPQSSIYLTIITEANKIAAVRGHTKAIVIYSDLQEFSRFFSIYDPRNMALLKQHPDQMRKLLEQIAKPTNLTGIDIYIIYNPKSEKDNDSFFLMSAVFKSILEDAGAKVYIGANVVEK